MILNGQNVNIWWGYKPVTEWAIEGGWFCGQYKACDTGSAYDVYKADIIFKGPESLIQTVESSGLNTSRESTFSLTCSEGEEIFGAELDYSSPLTVAVEGYPKTSRVSVPIHQASTLTLRLTSTPAFKTLTPSLSALTLQDISYDANSDWDIKSGFTRDHTASFQDGEADPGIFEAQFKQRPSDMADIRRYIMLTARANSFTFPLSWIDYPFGYRAGTGPFSVKIVDWEDLGRSRYSEWGLKLKHARVYT